MVFSLNNVMVSGYKAGKAGKQILMHDLPLSSLPFLLSLYPADVTGKAAEK
jgi:hypothetical protein